MTTRAQSIARRGHRFGAQAIGRDGYFFTSAIPEVVVPEYRGGGQQRGAEDQERLFREHWDYLDGLREIGREETVSVQVADDVRGARTIVIPLDAMVPDTLLADRPMRGTVAPTRVVDVIDNPLILAALALMIDEADD